MDIDVIGKEIEKLEQSELSWYNVQRLSWLYTVRDHMNVTNASDTMSVDGRSEFLKSVCGKNTGSIMKLLDEMMDATQVLSPKLYECFMMRISEL